MAEPLSPPRFPGSAAEETTGAVMWHWQGAGLALGLGERGTVEPAGSGTAYLFSLRKADGRHHGPRLPQNKYLANIALG